MATRYLYTADATDDYVRQRNIGTGAQIDTYTGTNNPSDVDADDTHVFFIAEFDYKLYKLLAADMSLVTSIGSSGSGNDQFSNPHGVGIDDTHVWVADRGNDRVHKRLKSDLSYVAQTSGLYGGVALDAPRGVASDVAFGGEHIYIADAGNDRVVKLKASDLSYVGAITGLDNPYGVAVDETYLYVANRDDDEIKRYLASDLSHQNSLGESGSGEGQFGSPYHCACDGYEGYVYVMDQAGNRLARLTYELVWVDTFAMPANSRGVGVVRSEGSSGGGGAARKAWRKLWWH